MTTQTKGKGKTATKLTAKPRTRLQRAAKNSQKTSAQTVDKESNLDYISNQEGNSPDNHQETTTEETEMTTATTFATETTAQETVAAPARKEPPCYSYLDLKRRLAEMGFRVEKSKQYADRHQDTWIILADHISESGETTVTEVEKVTSMTALGQATERFEEALNFAKSWEAPTEAPTEEVAETPEGSAETVAEVAEVETPAEAAPAAPEAPAEVATEIIYNADPSVIRALKAGKKVTLFAIALAEGTLTLDEICDRATINRREGRGYLQGVARLGYGVTRTGNKYGIIYPANVSALVIQ